MPDFLFEIGTEEIPAGYLPPALKQLEELVRKDLDALSGRSGDVNVEGTPRRIVLHASDLPVAQRSRTLVVAGPPEHVAFDAAGRPTKAAEGFARKVGVSPSALGVEETDRGRYCVATVTEEGRQVSELLAEQVPAWVRALHFPKSMVWEASRYPFPRPIRWICALLGSKVLPIRIAGVESGKMTHGHPFLSPGAIELTTPDWTEYRRLLRHAHVIVEVKPRRAEILRQLEELAQAEGGAFRHGDLVDEVTFLVEYPHATCGSFEERFLLLPPEVLESAMTEHQRYFPLSDGKNGKLLPKFLVVTNRSEAQADTVRIGNERVLRARLEDASFFFDADRKRTLGDYTERLSGVTFHQKVGTYAEKCERLAAWVERAAEILSLEEHRQAAQRAAALAKFDLVTDMVAEFPKLQGVMGAEYARHFGENDAVSRAIREQYLPRFAGDALPGSPPGTLVALADRLDNLACCFAIGAVPTGGADPFALRRQAHGVIRMLEEAKVSASVAALAAISVDILPAHLNPAPDLSEKLTDFFRERLHNYHVGQGRRHDFIRAVLGAGDLAPRSIVARLLALEELSKEADWERLVEVGVRTHRMGQELHVPVEVEAGLLQEPAEKDLHAALGVEGLKVLDLTAKECYLDAARLYRGSFAQRVHDFFEKVFVNVEDRDLRRNRLALIRATSDLFNARIANLAEIVMDG